MAQYELSLQDYWRIVRRRKYVLLTAFFSVLVGTVIFTNIQTPIYESQVTIKIEPPTDIPGLAVETGHWDIWTQLETEVKVITSQLVIEKALELQGFLMPDSSPEEIFRLYQEISSQTKTERIGDSNLLRLYVYSPDPLKSAQLANRIAEAYIISGLEEKNKRARELREFIGNQLSEAGTKLLNSEEKLKTYSQKGTVKGIGGFLATKLVDLQTQRTSLLKKYTTLHPELIKIEKQIGDIETQMKALPAEEIELARLAREVKINEELYTLLSKKFKEAQISEADKVQTAFIVSRASVPLSPVRPNRRLNLLLGVLLGIFLGTAFAFVLENLDTSIGTIEDVESYLGLPVLAIIPHLERRRKEMGLRQFPFLSIRHQERIGLLRSRLIVYHPPKSPFTEAYHTLRTNISYTTLQKKGALIIFTSAGVEEGKTITAANFALASAQAGLRTFLVEADLRRPAVHRIFGLSRDPGFSDCLLGNISWREAVRGTTDFLLGELALERVLHTPGIENLQILTCGPPPLNPVDLLNSPAVGRIFQEISKEFDLIVLDCPPVLLFSDVLLFAPQSSGVILVYKSGRMSRGALKRAKGQLENTKAHLLGVVLNDLKSSEIEPRYGYYYSHYRDYDSSQESADSGKESG